MRKAMHDRDCWIAPGEPARLDHVAAMERLAAESVALLGERHDQVRDHRWQAAVIAGLAALRGRVAVGFEMFPRGAQPVLDAWVSGSLSETRFLEAARWSEVWGFEAALYLPIFHLCRDLRLPMLAMNVDRPIVTLVGRDGWDALPPAERAWLTPARAARSDYRRYLFAITGGARPGRAATCPEDPAFDRFVRAQQVWDRAFACAIAGYLAEAPDALVVGVVGRGHLEFGYGTPDQLDDLGVGGAVVALPDAELDETGPPIADLVFARREDAEPAT